MQWRFDDAKRNLANVVTRACTEGPQTIHHHNDSVVVLSQTDYLALAGRPLSLKQSILNGPPLDNVASSRDRSQMRSVDL